MEQSGYVPVAAGVVIILCLLWVLTVLIVALMFSRRNRIMDQLKAIEQELQGLPRLHNLYAVQSVLSDVSHLQQQLPNQILRCLQGNLNTLKGQTAELVAYLRLNAQYDRLLPFNSIADFIGIKFPSGDEPGRLDFIDIKTGSARLSQEQARLKRIIENKQINFVKIRITTDIPTSPCEDSECAST